MFRPKLLSSSRGFTTVELLLACVIFPIIVVGVSNALDAIRTSYTTAKQLNEVYAVLSTCPELDRALDYTSLTSSTNCFPNNTLAAEGGSSNTFTYTPSLSVQDTSLLPNTDPLHSVPDSKVVDISVQLLKSNAPPLELRMLVSRNGIAQQ